jgi:hypothetical protein
MKELKCEIIEPSSKKKSLDRLNSKLDTGVERICKLNSYAKKY